MFLSSLLVNDCLTIFSNDSFPSLSELTSFNNPESDSDW
jgi:hypothetical protein